MQSKATSIQNYLAELPHDRREAIIAIRDTIRKNLDSGYEEGIQSGMISYYVPHEIYPAGYHCKPTQPLPFACLVSQKNHLSLYLMSVYASATELAWFQKAWKKSGKKLDMGKSCVRFKSLEDVPLEVIGEAIRRMPVKKFVSTCQKSLETWRSGKAASEKKRAKKKTTTVEAGKAALRK